MRFTAGDWKAFVEGPDYAFRNSMYRIFLYRDVNETEMEYMQADGTVTRVNVGDLRPDNAKPTFEIPMSAAQSLMTMLWKSGVRPDVPDTGEVPKLLREVIAAKDEHLDDLRKMVLEAMAREKR